MNRPNQSMLVYIKMPKTNTKMHKIGYFLPKYYVSEVRPLNHEGPVVSL